MIYHKVEIKPNRALGRYEVHFSVIEGDRIAKPKAKPHSLGFYYYPETIPKAKAFEAVKSRLVSTLKNRIALLQQDLVALESLTLPDAAD